MQWQRRDTVETLAALALLSVVFGVLVFAVWRRTGSRRHAGAARRRGVSAGVVPGRAASPTSVRRRPDCRGRASRCCATACPASIAAAILLAFLRWPTPFERWLRRGLLADLVRLGGRHRQPWTRSVARRGGRQRAPQAAAARRMPRHARPSWRCCSMSSRSRICTTAPRCGRDTPRFAVFRRPRRTTWPCARRPMKRSSRCRAISPGATCREVRVDETELMELGEDGELMPFSPAEATGLFATARRLGYRTEMAGYYLPYCSLLGDLVDVCRSLSFYNASGVRDGFSPLNPIETTLDHVAAAVSVRDRQEPAVRAVAARPRWRALRLCPPSAGRAAACVPVRALQRASPSFRLRRGRLRPAAQSAPHVAGRGLPAAAALRRSPGRRGAGRRWSATAASTARRSSCSRITVSGSADASATSSTSRSSSRWQGRRSAVTWPSRRRGEVLLTQLVGESCERLPVKRSHSWLTARPATSSCRSRRPLSGRDATRQSSAVWRTASRCRAAHLRRTGGAWLCLMRRASCSFFPSSLVDSQTGGRVGLRAARGRHPRAPHSLTELLRAPPSIPTR